MGEAYIVAMLIGNVYMCVVYTLSAERRRTSLPCWVSSLQLTEISSCQPRQLTHGLYAMLDVEC